MSISLEGLNPQTKSYDLETESDRRKPTEETPEDVGQDIGYLHDDDDDDAASKEAGEDIGY